MIIHLVLTVVILILVLNKWSILEVILEFLQNDTTAYILNISPSLSNGCIVHSYLIKCGREINLIYPKQPEKLTKHLAMIVLMNSLFDVGL